MLSVENLTWQDAKGWGFQNLSLHVNAGEALILRGPNGSGKSTLLRILAGLIETPVSSCKMPFHYIGHKSGLIENLSVQKNIDIFQRLAGNSQPHNWPLADILSQKVRDLSKGQKQRVALSRLAISSKPLWLLDEPMAGLDQKSHAFFVHQLDHHLQQGGAAVLALHEEIALNSPSRNFRMGE